jgi:3-phenylpropionate/trans-cinnamate dioxygenase ferredoxin reductase subunit
LTGRRTAVSCELHPVNHYAERNIDFRSGQPVAKIEARAHQVELTSGERIDYDQLLITTGAEVRRLPIPGTALNGVHYLRTRDDAAALQTDLLPGRALVVIGGGFIGLEAAASAVALGCRVTVLEAGSRVLGRGVPAALAEMVADQHRARDVDIRCGVRPVALLGEDRVQAVRLEDGTELPADVVLIGIGVRPATELASAAGLAVDDGILVDEHCRSSDADVFAAGDCVRFRHPLFDSDIRLECWRNAEVQSRTAAACMLGLDERYSEVPWMWSNQYDLTLQVVGLPDAADTLVRRGSTLTDPMLFFHLREGRLIGASGLGIGSAVGREIRLAQMLIARRSKLDADKLADPAVPLKKLLTLASLS